MSTASVPELPPAWSEQDSLYRVLDAVAGRRQRQLPDGSVMVQCVQPAHEDRNPSMHVTWEPTEHGGRTLVYCHSCGPGISQEDWAQYLNLEVDDLFDDRRWSWHHRPGRPETRRRSVRTRKQAARHGRPGKLPDPIVGRLHELLDQPAPEPSPPDCAHSFEHVEDYDYADETGQVRHRVTRQVCSSCGHKNFPQQWRVKGRWEGSKPPGTPVWLYRHPQVVAAAADGAQIWLLEGEKDVHAAEALGLVATTNPGGATAFQEALAPVFAGAHVTVVLDRDDAGWLRGVRVHQLLTQAGAATVRLALPLVTTPKADFTDHVQAGHDPRVVDEVPLEAVRAWAGLKEVRRHREMVETCEAEAQAQLQVARYDTRKGRKAKAADRRRYAARWADEALRNHWRMVDAATDVLKHVRAVPGDRWATEAGEVAASTATAVAGLVASVYELVDQPPPAELETTRTVLDHAAAGAAPAADEPPLEDGAAPPGDAPGPGWTPRVVPGGADPGGGGGGSWYRTGVRISAPDYNVVLSNEGQLELVQIKNEQRGRGEDATWEQTFSRVLNCDVKIVRRERAESDDEIDDSLIDLDSLGDRDPSMRTNHTPTLGKTSHVVIRVQDHPDTDPQTFRVPFDDYLDGSFVGHLPVPGLTYQTSRAGRERIVTAINYVSTAAQIVTSYRATGWRHVEGQDMWVTANGAIGQDGWIPIPSHLSGPLARFDMPMPTTDPARLRAAFLDHSAGMMDRFPDRIAAVLLGTAYRAVVCPNEWVTVLTASPGVGKTGLAALTMHHYGELWDRTRPLTSLSGNGATTNALRLLLHQVKDGLAFLDDNAPTGGVEQAYRRLEELIRMIHNAEGKPRSSRDGQETLPEGRPRASGLVTTELPPRAGTSGERRALMVPMAAEEVRIDQIRAMDVLESRHGRALLSSSFVRWIAAAGRRDTAARLAGLREEFETWVGEHPDQVPSHARHAPKIAELYAGWALMIECLTELGALQAGEANAWRSRVATALLTAAESAEDPDLVGSTGQRVRDLLRYALSNGLAYASSIRDGTCPAGLERVTGWVPVNRPPSDGEWARAPEWRRASDRAIHLGYVNPAPSHTSETGPELVCTRTALEATLKAAAAGMTDTSTIDLGTALRALQDEGILKVSVEHRGDSTITRKLLARTITCEKSVADPDRATRDKRVVLRLEVLLGGDDDPGQDEQPPGPPSAPPPGHDPGPPEGFDPDPEPEVGPEMPAPEHPDMEDPMTRSYTNAGGLTLPAVHHPRGQCVTGCGLVSGYTFDGLWMHLPCFENTTASTLQELHDQLDGSPPVPATTPTSTSEPAPWSTHPPGPPSPRPPRRTAGSPAGDQLPGAFTASCVVVDVDGYYLPGRTKAALPFPIEHAGHLEQLGRQLHLGHAPMRWRTVPEAGLVVPTQALWEQLGVPTDVPTRANKRRDWFTQVSAGLSFLTGATDNGWVFGRGQGDPVLRGMTRLRRPDAERGTVAIVFTPGMPADWGLGPQVNPAAVATRLQLVSTALGIPFRASPISTGLDLLKIVLPRDVRVALSAANAVDYDTIGPASMAECEPSFDWTRIPTADEKAADFLVLFDRGGSYASTWSSLKVGIGAPERHEEDLGFDPRRAGWWLVQLPTWGEADRNPYPDLLDPQGNRSGQQVWVTTPVLEYAVKELDVDPVVVASWTWPPGRSKAWLKPLYEVLRDALTTLRATPGPDSAAAQYLVKQIYKQLSGHLISTDSDTTARAELRGRDDVLDMHHPYAFHAMRGKARVAMLHQILKVGGERGSWPVVVSNNDLIGYPATTVEEAGAWPGDRAKLGRGFGDYKLDRWAPMGEHAPFLTGRGWSGLDRTHRMGESP